MISPKAAPVKMQGEWGEGGGGDADKILQC